MKKFARIASLIIFLLMYLQLPVYVSAQAQFNSAPPKGEQKAEGRREPKIPRKNSTNASAARKNAADIPDDVADAIEQRRIAYGQLLKAKIESALSKGIFGNENIVSFEIDLDLEKLQAAFEKNEKVYFNSLPSAVSRGQLSLQFLENLTDVQFKSFVKPLQIEITLSENISPDQRQLVRKVLTSAIELPAKSSWKISFAKLSSAETQAIIQTTIEEKKKLEREVSADREKFKDETNRIARDREVIARQKDSLDGERRTLEIKLKQEQDKNIFLQSEIDKLKMQLDEQKNRIAKFEEELSIYKTPLGDIKKLIKGLELPLTIFPIFILLMLLMIVALAVMNAAQRKRAGMMKDGVELIATTLGKLGSKGSHMGQFQKAMEKELSARGGAGAGAGFDSQHELSSTGSGGALSAGGSGALSAEMERLKSDAEVAWRECIANPFLTHSVLKEWLQGGAAGVGKFVSITSTLSPVEAAQLSDVFDPEETRAVNEVVPDLSYRLRGYSVTVSLFRSILEFSGGKKAFLKGTEFAALIRANDAQLAAVIFRTNPQQRVHIFEILPQARWKRVLEKGSEMYPAEFMAARIAEFTQGESPPPEHLLSLAQELNTELAQVLEKTAAASSKSRIHDLTAGLDLLSPKTKAAIALAQQQFPTFAAAMERATVTFDAVLKLEKTILVELLEPFESEEIAQLLCSLEPNKRQFLVPLISEKQRITAQADFERFAKSKSGLKRAESEGAKIQDIIITKAKAMAAEGIVDFSAGLAKSELGEAPDAAAEISRSA